MRYFMIAIELHEAILTIYTARHHKRKDRVGRSMILIMSNVSFLLEKHVNNPTSVFQVVYLPGTTLKAA
jgi:hypothetical protein